MGVTAFTKDNQGLYKHEGYVLAELDIQPLYTDPGDRWTSTSCQEHDGHETGRHRAGCQCGWRGPIVETGVREVFLDEAIEVKIMTAWEDHIGPMVAAMEGTAELKDALVALDDAHARVRTAVRAARSGGVTWDQIGTVLGITRQAAWERFRDV